jgi:hypothetical protein
MAFQFEATTATILKFLILSLPLTITHKKHDLRNLHAVCLQQVGGIKQQKEQFIPFSFRSSSMSLSLTH